MDDKERTEELAKSARFSLARWSALLRNPEEFDREYEKSTPAIRATSSGEIAKTFPEFAGSKLDAQSEMSLAEAAFVVEMIWQAVRTAADPFLVIPRQTR